MPHADLEVRRAYQKAYQAEWRITHRASLKVSHDKWKKSHPEKLAAKKARWAKKYIAERRVYSKQRYATSSHIRLVSLHRSKLNRALSEPNPSCRLSKDLGCTFRELRIYIESKFAEGMTWGNRGNGAGQWSIDHIMPMSAFNMEDRQHHLLACHYGNLQPLWHVENMKKGNTVR
jgi:hypothetical protein